jgi:hypothetical protein
MIAVTRGGAYDCARVQVTKDLTGNKILYRCIVASDGLLVVQLLRTPCSLSESSTMLGSYRGGCFGFTISGGTEMVLVAFFLAGFLGWVCWCAWNLYHAQELS